MAGTDMIGRSVRLDSLQVGELLAEGGEGRVFELPRQPHLVFKCYRAAGRREYLDDLVAWPGRIGDAAFAGRVAAATAWPAATVTNTDDAGAVTGAGVLLPRAPRRFALRHRDGTTRLATLSYLTADPAHRAVAYGLHLPDPVSPERLGLVYALARLLEGLESGPEPVGHGDLSTKNVLWSLQRGPEVFVLDCDNCEYYDSDGRPLAPAGRRRAMTPNWEDPAVPAGSNPTLASDRYSLALIFLRVVGAANFPIQARQRQRQPVAVDFAMPPGRFGEAQLGPGADLWRLCEQGLSVSDPSGRPGPAAWAGALEAVLDALGAVALLRAVQQAQGGAGQPSGAFAPARPNGGLVNGTAPPADSGHDVVIRPVMASPRPAPRWTEVAPEVPGPAWRRPGAPAAFVTAGTAALGGGSGAPLGPASPSFAPGGGANRSVLAQALTYLAQAAAWLVALHRHTARALWTSGRRAHGLRQLALCTVLDVVVALVGLFVVAMIVAPVLGI
jgi:hypothetical protein